MDDDCKVKCALVDPAGAGEFGKAEIGNEIDNEHMHAWISHNRVDENYVD